MIKIDRFESLSDFVQHVSTKPILATDPSSKDTERPDFYLASFTEACQLALNGWQSKADEIKRLSASMTSKVTALVERHDVVYDVEGAQVDIGRFCDGEPECWQRWEPKVIEGFGVKHIRLVYSARVSALISTESITAKGATVLALIECLEYAGCRVSLDVAVSYAVSNQPFEAFECYVNVKSADQPLDVPRLAFVLAHPSMLRRLFWRFDEQQTFWRALGAGNHGYSGNMERRECSEEGDMYFGRSNYGEPQWESTTETTAWILAQMEKQGIELHKETV